MFKHLALVFAIAVSTVGFAQFPAQTSDSAPSHYRLTFVIDSGQGEAGKQSFMLEVPVVPGKMGAAAVNLVSGSKGDPQSVAQQSFECTEIHRTATGLGLHIAMQSDREVAAIPGLVSARHSHGEFQRTVDLEIGKPTVVTQPTQFKVLGNTNPALAEKLRQPAPMITVTAQAL